MTRTREPRSRGGILDGFAPFTSDGEAIAPGLYETLSARRTDAGIAHLSWRRSRLAIVLESGEYWAIDCLGPDAFRLFPGVVRGDVIDWLNIWGRSDYTLEELAENLDDVFSGTGRMTA